MKQQGRMGWFKHDITNRGVTAWLLFALLLSFYFFLYFPDKFAEFGQVFSVHKPLQNNLSSWGSSLNIFEHFMIWLGTTLNQPIKAGWDPLWNKWTLYGTIYTTAITFGGIHVIRKYKHNRYQIVRTLVVIFVQASFAFSIPLMLGAGEHYSYYYSYFWPLKIDYLLPSTLQGMPLHLMLYSVLGAMLFVPVMGIFFGKRWYCSWVCGCGGLANTFGDPWRQLSDKSSKAWAFERVSIHLTLALALATTAFMVVNNFIDAKTHPNFAQTARTVKFFYDVVIVALLSGAVGVAFYPIGGTRLWCRFFCPMAALLGLVQKLGRYRITVKKNMCISCGMCSSYCEMGIDVRAYAQKNESFVRASCVGCGLCAEVCPRGVLKLENRWDQGPQQLSMKGFLAKNYKH